LVVAPAAWTGVDVRFDEGTDFSRFATYELKEGTPARRAGAQKLIAHTLENALDDRGFRRVDRDPDVYVVSHVLVDVQRLEDLDDPDYWQFITGVRAVDAYDVGAATLVVDLVDAQTKAVVWRGIVTEAVKGSVEKMQRRIDKGVRRLFKQLPG
jgi:hypothetical protein